MPKELYSGAYLGTVATGEDLKKLFGADGLKGLSKPKANPRPELEKIALKLTTRAEEIVKEKSIPFGDAYKQAASESPDDARRYREFTAIAHRSGGVTGDE